MSATNAIGLNPRATENLGKALLATWFVAMVIFLFGPIVASLVYAFNEGVVGKQVSTFTGFTWEWFPAAWNDRSLRSAVSASLWVALWVALVAVIGGGALGYSVVRHPSERVRSALSGLIYALLIVPESVIGVSLLLFYAQSGISLNTLTLIAGITPSAMAVVALIVRARVLTLDRRMEEAASDLGASGLKTLWLIILPQVAPALGAGAVMSYTFAFDNLVIATFLTTPRVNTLPVYLYGSLNYGSPPTIFAAAAVVFVFTLILLAIAGLMMRSIQRMNRPAPIDD